MMVRILLFSALLLYSLGAKSQQTRIKTDPLQALSQAKELYQNGQYNLAYPILLDLRNKIRSKRTIGEIASDELEFYIIAIELKRNEASAEKQALLFVQLNGNDALQQKMSFQLAEFYFRQQDYRNAIISYEQASAANLSEEERAGMDFRLGYGYFSLQQYDKAWGFLQRAANDDSGPYYADANYYYGYLVFNKQRYEDALEFFKRVDTHPQYGKVAPYYIATIYYQQGKKEQAITYAEDVLKKSSSAAYDIGLKRMLGHAYFEKKLFTKALPFLQTYIAQTPKASREDLYQLSYCFYENRQFSEAINGFKGLTDGQDSLSQSAMYLLGDAYLKTGQPENARNAFSFSARNSSNEKQKEVSMFNYGKLSFELGYQDVAITELRSFLQMFPSSTFVNEGKEILAMLLAGTSNYREAFSLIESMLNPSSVIRKLSPRVFYGRAMEWIGDGRNAAADSLLDRILFDYPDAGIMSAVHFWKGELSFRQHKFSEAIRFMNMYLDNPKIQEAEVQTFHARYTLGYALLKSENYAKARDQFDQISANSTITFSELERDAFIRSADCSFMLKDFVKAKSKYNTVISSNWSAADYATYQLAMIEGINSSDEKIRLLMNFEKKYSTSPLRSTAYLEISNTYLADEKFKEAIPYLQQLLKTETPTSSMRPKAFLRLGIAFYNLDNSKDALKSYESLVSEYPNSSEVEEALESARAIFLEEGRTNDFVTFAKQAGRSVSVAEQDSLAFAAAENKLAYGDQISAINSFNAYLKEFPTGAYVIEALYLRSDLYVKRNELEKALDGLVKLAELAPNKYAEQSVAQAARIYYFNIKDFEKAENYFIQYKAMATLPTNRIDAMRGLLRCQYQLKKWEEGFSNANELLQDKAIGTDDKVLAYMILGKFLQANEKLNDALSQYKNVITLSKAAYAAEARYETAAIYFSLNDLKTAEKAAFETINKSGSYDYWITKAYLLLGDVFIKQKDIFNAKATLQSVADNSEIPELKKEAESKLAQIAYNEK
ncbi:MAG: tetratricopeptide repeat protein [Sphingobacteriales bacterium]